MSDDMPAAKRLGGRPRKPIDELRSERIEFCVTIAEADAIMRAAVQARLAVGDLILNRAGFRSDKTLNPFRRDPRGATLRGK